MDVLLYRDSFTTPWGFRLQGGKDLKAPLVVQRVFANSPAEGYLQRGDTILTLNGRDASGLSHKEAQDLFASAGGQIPLVIRRVQVIKKEPPPPKATQQKPLANKVSKRAHRAPRQTDETMSPTLKSSTTKPLRKTKVESSPAKVKERSFGGGGFEFGTDYSKVKVQADYVPGPVYNEEEAAMADELDQGYRTIPFELPGPTTMAQAHVPKGGLKYGGGGPDYGVCYVTPGAAPPPIQRQSSKPWEDKEMLHKVQDTLSHISYPYQSTVDAINGGMNYPLPTIAPPPYIPGPPPPSDLSYIDPFAPPAPQPPADEDEEYEFVPVSQRRGQFNKADFVPEPPKPILPRKAHPVYQPAPPLPAAPKPTPMSPIPPPMFVPTAKPAEGIVIQNESPAWVGTLSSSGGPKMWQEAHQQPESASPVRSVSPSKRAGKKAPTPVPTQDFAPTKTQTLDFSNDPDDGPRILHLQYNSPLDMYSRQNVVETLQGQTQAAMGGGNTATPQKKVPAEERDWSQSTLLRMIQANEHANVPSTAPMPAIQGTPRPAVSPVKAIIPPPQAPSPAPKPKSPVPQQVDIGVSDF